MKTFSDIKFNGTFREYQQRVLDSSDKYLMNNKIHIVAAPGSGKTILGIELIRRLNAPCIVLSPTNTIRYQWGDRFEGMFLSEDKNVDDYVSYDLNDLKLMTSITYQALHSCINKIGCIDEDGAKFDYSNIDLFKLIKEYGIRTICLDEAHHLQNEWQKALEIFIRGIDKNIKVIALTATPPYDATDVEWDRYMSVCGEIDEEIFVSELVKCKNLCPHQDYIYFNYPTPDESLFYIEFKKSVDEAFIELEKSLIFSGIPKIIYSHKKDVFDNLQSYIDLAGLCQKLNVKFNDNKMKKILNTDSYPQEWSNCENALNFVLKSDVFMKAENKEAILKIFKKHKLVSRNSVCIASNDKVDKALIYSMGKLESIANIVSCEYANLKENLRMLVLTDFIKKNTVSMVNTNEPFKDISVVSIFESIRRLFPKINIAILSGSLVVLPTALEESVRKILGKNASKLKTTIINDSEYSEYTFSLSNKEKVAAVGQLFENGLISVIVGTKSLLGEGWDSPCINSLIMASFVGSFMLSNQMRGRAIRVFKKDPNKTANIWHLVTLEPELEDKKESLQCNEETSVDYKTLKRRFDCFVGPHYTQKGIESGINRVSVLKDSYTPECVKEVNEYMEKNSANREEMAKKWNIDGNGIMYMQTSIPKSKIPTKLSIFNGIVPITLLTLAFIFTAVVWPSQTSSSFVKFVLCIVSIVEVICLLLSAMKFFVFAIPKLFVRSLSKSLWLGLVELGSVSPDSKLKVKNNKKEKTIDVLLISDNIKEQKVFSDSISQFFSPLIDSRYVICKTWLKIKLYKFSFQLPKVFATNKGTAEGIVNKLNFLCPVKIIYNSAQNKNAMNNCKKHSYLNKDMNKIIQKQTLI